MLRRIFLPLPVLQLQRLREARDLAACERWQLAAREQHLIVQVEVREVELHTAADRAEERRVATAFHPEAERFRGVGQPELESRGMRFELAGHAAQEKHAARAEHAEPESLDVRGS